MTSNDTPNTNSSITGKISNLFGLEKVKQEQEMKEKIKVAFVTGCTGQDGFYLTKLLLSKGYIVHGLIRRSSSINTQRLNPFYQDRHEEDIRLFLHYGDITDASCLERLLRKIRPDEVYNLAAMSHVKVSFECPENTSEIDALGALKLLEACRNVTSIEKPIRYYQAGTSELYGGVYTKAQNEDTPFNPRSPYAVAKLYAHWITKNYRESYNMFCCNGVLFNHTSPHRGHTFVEQKIVKAAVAIKQGTQDCLYLGNIYSSRDFGHAADYTEAMWLMLQQDQPDDYVIASGKTYVIKDIINKVFEILDMELTWQGEGIDEVGKVDSQEGKKIVIRIDPSYFRPSEVDTLLGDSTKARTKLKWQPKFDIDDILNDMIWHEIKNNEK